MNISLVIPAYNAEATINETLDSVAAQSHPVDEIVIVDLNHQMAGHTLHFSVEVVEIREATSDELAHGHAHGPGHHH